MSAILKFVKWSALSLIVLFICAVAIFSIFKPNCSGDSAEADYARSISEERLAKLFDQLLEIKLADDLKRQDPSKWRDVTFPEGIHVPHEYIPKELKDLEFYNVRISKIHSRIMLKGCFDHFLTLNIQGLYGEGNPKITLNWGEIKSENEVLWER